MDSQYNINNTIYLFLHGNLVREQRLIAFVKKKTNIATFSTISYIIIKD